MVIQQERHLPGGQPFDKSFDESFDGSDEKSDAIIRYVLARNFHGTSTVSRKLCDRTPHVQYRGTITYLLLLCNKTVTRQGKYLPSR